MPLEKNQIHNKVGGVVKILTHAIFKFSWCHDEKKVKSNRLFKIKSHVILDQNTEKVLNRVISGFLGLRKDPKFTQDLLQGQDS